MGLVKKSGLQFGNFGRSQVLRAPHVQECFRDLPGRVEYTAFLQLMRPEHPLFREDLKGPISEKQTPGHLLQGGQGTALFLPELAVSPLLSLPPSPNAD